MLYNKNISFDFCSCKSDNKADHYRDGFDELRDWSTLERCCSAREYPVFYSRTNQNEHRRIFKPVVESCTSFKAFQQQRAFRP